MELFYKDNTDVRKCDITVCSSNLESIKIDIKPNCFLMLKWELGKSLFLTKDCVSYNKDIELKYLRNVIIDEKKLNLEKIELTNEEKYYIEEVLDIENKIYELNIKYAFLKKGFVGFLHETKIDNFVKILRNQKVICRNDLDCSFTDIANKEVIEQTRKAVKKFVRFYYFKNTPSNYIFNKNNPSDLVFLVFDWKITAYPNAFFMDGNAGSKYSKEYDVSELFSGKLKFDIDLDEISRRGPYDSCSREGPEIKRKRNAELLIYKSIDLKYLNKVIFKSIDARNNFIEKYKFDNMIMSYKNLFEVDSSYFY